MSRWIRTLKQVFAAAAIATCGATAHAQSSFTFDSAMLDINALATEFTLSTSTFPTTWGANAFIGAVAVDYSGTSSGVTTSNVTGGGVTTVSTSSASGPGGSFDIRFGLGGSSSDRLTANETVSWNVSGLTGGEVTTVALHIQGLDTANFAEGSIWLTPGGTPPIPEPSTYALFLLGLLAIGFLARKRVSGYPLPA